MGARLAAKQCNHGKLLDVIIEKAPGLRQAGVLAVELGEVKFSLLPAVAGDAPAGRGGAGDLPPANPFRDPASYPNGVEPGFGPPTDDD